MTNILVATDFSDGANHAVDYATRLAVALGVPLHIVHAHEPMAMVGPDPMGFAVPFDDTSIRIELARHLERDAARARQQGVHAVEHELAIGVAWSQILRVAEAHRCDLIVISTHGRGGVPRLLLGSVADKVVRKATCPVLTIGPRA